MNDSISKQAVISAIDQYYKDKRYITRSRRTLSAICQDIKSTMKSLPSVQEQRWIPVSKKKPNGQELVNISCHDTSGDTSFDYTSSGWTTTDGEYWIVDNEINNYVVAWMPLPEPYKEYK